MRQKNNEPVRFTIIFLILFFIFYYFNIAFFGITSEGRYYSAFLADHVNYIDWLRWLLLKCSAGILSGLGYTVITSKYQLLVIGIGSIRLIYTCLGFGVMSFFAAFVLAYPKPRKPKLIFLFAGLFAIQLLNVIRFVLLSLFWDRQSQRIIDHHTIFNIIIYIIIVISLYFWVRSNNIYKNNAANRSLKI